MDLHDNEEDVVDAGELKTHLTVLLQNKVEAVIAEHAAERAGQPLFLYYAMQNIHTGADEGFVAPQEYLDMCTLSSAGQSAASEPDDLRAYCALNIMLDEAIGRTRCAIAAAGMDNNTIFIVANDNGGQREVPGSNAPLSGAKGGLNNGGILTQVLHLSLSLSLCLPLSSSFSSSLSASN